MSYPIHAQQRLLVVNSAPSLLCPVTLSSALKILATLIAQTGSLSLFSWTHLLLHVGSTYLCFCRESAAKIRGGANVECIFVFSYFPELQYCSACCPMLKSGFLIYCVWFYNYIWRNASPVPFTPLWQKVERTGKIPLPLSFQWKRYQR